jgi:uncharacterized Rossmann fold enzyme
MMEYWEECISEAFDDAGIEASKDQIETVASWIEGAHDNYGMAHGHDCIPNPENEEIKQLKQEIKRLNNEHVRADESATKRLVDTRVRHGMRVTALQDELEKERRINS